MDVYAQVTIVKSQQGNGGTHMMNTIAKQLMDEGHLVCSLSAEQLLNRVECTPDQFRQHLLSHAVIVVDDLDFLIRRNEVACITWLSDVLHEFIGGGGRFMFTHTSWDMTIDEWLMHLGTYTMVEHSSTYPSSIDTLKSIAEQYVSAATVKHHIHKVHRSSTSIRTFINMLVTYEARNKLKYMV